MGSGQDDPSILSVTVVRHACGDIQPPPTSYGPPPHHAMPQYGSGKRLGVCDNNHGTRLPEKVDFLKVRCRNLDRWTGFELTRISLDPEGGSLGFVRFGWAALFFGRFEIAFTHSPFLMEYKHVQQNPELSGRA